MLTNKQSLTKLINASEDTLTLVLTRIRYLQPFIKDYR